MATKIVMPRLSLAMKTGTVIQWFKKEGESVEKGEPIVEVLSEKVTYDIEAPVAGILRRILVEEGAETPVDATLGILGGQDETLPQEWFEHKPPTLEPPSEAMAQEAPAAAPDRKRVVASPAAKRLARMHNVDLTKLTGLGPQGRIGEEEVKRFIEEKEKTTSLHIKVKEDIPLAGIRKTTAERVTSSFQTAPHSFIIMEVDMTEAARLREKTQVSYTSILVDATAKALRENPMVNSSLVEGHIRVYEDINIGVAVSTEDGLVVPVIHNADKKQLTEISLELRTLAEEARQGKTSKAQLSGGTFTVTNLGMYGVKMFLPIINPPEAAILAVGATVEKPVVTNEKIAVSPIMTLTLAYDHRIIDGAPAAAFLKQIKEAIEKAG